jgi:hypothetical protein
MLRRVRLLLLVVLIGGAFSAFATDAQWVEVHSPDFTVFTDAGEKRGRQAALHFEQCAPPSGCSSVKQKQYASTVGNHCIPQHENYSLELHLINRGGEAKVIDAKLKEAEAAAKATPAN